MTCQLQTLFAVIALSNAAVGCVFLGLAGLRHQQRLRGGVIGQPPLIFNEGHTIRGNGNGGPTTPRPQIIPTGAGHSAPPEGPPIKPQFPPPRTIREDWF